MTVLGGEYSSLKDAEATLTESPCTRGTDRRLLLLTESSAESSRGRRSFSPLTVTVLELLSRVWLVGKGENGTTKVALIRNKGRVKYHHYVLLVWRVQPHVLPRHLRVGDDDGALRLASAQHEGLADDDGERLRQQIRLSTKSSFSFRSVKIYLVTLAQSISDQVGNYVGTRWKETKSSTMKWPIHLLQV